MILMRRKRFCKFEKADGIRKNFHILPGQFFQAKTKKIKSNRIK